MSAPKAKTPSPAEAPSSKIPVESNVGEKPATKPVQKKIVPAGKTRIPKQSVSATVADDASSSTSTVTKTKDEKPSTANKPRAGSKSLDKPPLQPVLPARPKVSMSVGSVVGQKRNLENKYSIMKKKYVVLKSDVESKQESIESAFQELLLLREKIISSGGRDPGDLDELTPVQLWSAQRGRIGEGNHSHGGDNAAKGNSSDRTSSHDKDFVVHLESTLKALPETFLAFCEEVTDKMSNAVTWLAEFEQEARDEPTPINLRDEMTSHIELYKSETDELRERLGNIRQEQLSVISAIVKSAGCLWHECQAFRKERENCNNSELIALEETAEALTKELRVERDKLSKARAKIREQDTALKSAHDKVKELETRVNEKEAALAPALEHAKDLEKQLKQKAAELVKCQKSKDQALKLEKQKETVDGRVTKLQKELEKRESEVKTLMKTVETMEQNLEAERKAKEDLELEFETFNERNKKLEEKCQQLLEVQESKPDEEMKETGHTEYDIQLFNELKETQRSLMEKEEIVRRLRVEREEIMAAVNEADQENDSSRQRLSAELIRKSNELEASRSQMAQMQKSYKKLQQKTEQLETKLRDITKVNAQMKDGNKSAYSTQLMLLQQQLTDTRGSLGEVNARNEELQKVCTGLQLKLEQYKRYLKSQEKNSRVRRELQMLLQNKEDHGDGAEGVEKAKFSAVSYEDYRHLYDELEQKELQILKLETLVKQMEKQEEYAQTQRTRLESRIASLELTLKETEKTHRYVIQDNRGAAVHQPIDYDESYDLEALIRHPARDEYDFYANYGVGSRHRKCRSGLKNELSLDSYSYFVSGSSGSKRHACGSKHVDVDGYAYVRKTRDAAKRGVPIYKWFLKPFIRENSSSQQVVHRKRHYKCLELGDSSSKSRRANDLSRRESSDLLYSTQNYEQ